VHGKLILELQIRIFLHTNPSDPRIIQTLQKSVESFRMAAQLFAPQVEFIEIPYDGTIPGYFYEAENVKFPRPTLIHFSGFDGTQEERHKC
jgi:predicted alpha/beta-fold hydrolase